jgi:antirestriction protein
MTTFTITDAHNTIVSALANARVSDPANVPGPVLAEWLETFPKWQADAVAAWISNGAFGVDGDGLPDPSDFDEAYAGEWGSFREYAEELADDIGMLGDVPEEVARYFDWDRWTRDLAYDYTTEPAPNGGVYVFRNI